MWTLWSLLFIVVVIETQKPIAEVRYEWKFINYTWPSKEIYYEAIAKNEYIPKNNMLVGIKVWKDKFYLAVPRNRPGVPVTLATVPYWPVGEGTTSPNLQPYPNWDMQKMDDCKTSLQSVQAMEIDPAGRMWVLNVGRIVSEPNSTKVCPHRLVVFDLENEDKIVLDYEFPEDVLDPNTGYLNDIVLDHTDGGYAYITNSDSVKPSIVVFSLEAMSSWQVTDESMYADNNVNFTVKGENIASTNLGTVNGIALEFADLQQYRALYFTPLSSPKLYFIYTVFLKSMKNISEYVHTVDSKPRTHTAGMIINSNNELFFGELEDNTVGVLNFRSGKYRPAYTDSKLQWIDTYAIDESGSMWVTVNRLPRVTADKLDLNEINYRVVKLDQRGFKNYQYCSDGSVPELPVIRNSRVELYLEMIIKIAQN